jgi:hypothetical protein
VPGSEAIVDNESLSAARRLRRGGALPSAILRQFALSKPTASVPDLMQLARETFALPHDAVQCIGGWWHDGSGELSDEQLDAFLLAAIAKASHDRVDAGPE